MVICFIQLGDILFNMQIHNYILKPSFCDCVAFNRVENVKGTVVRLLVGLNLNKSSNQQQFLFANLLGKKFIASHSELK